MKSFGTYISRHLASFAGFIVVLLALNGIAFGVTFYNTIIEDYGDNSPSVMLETMAKADTSTKISQEMEVRLQENNIWAIYLNQAGEALWTASLPDDVPTKYTIQDVALFSKGYIADYPVFVRNMEDGLLILGYPKDSYTKLTSNYYSIGAIRRLLFFIVGLFAADLIILFLAYYISKRRIIKNTQPIVEGVKSLSLGKPVSLNVQGELGEVADSVNKAALIISRQNEARSNWISGVSHDIRTPLSMIMGYGEKIAENKSASDSIKEQAKIVCQQSVKIKELVQDLNLVSQLEYEMQPLHSKKVRLSKLVRSYIAEFLNAGIYEKYTFTIAIDPDVETMALECDERLITRAINNLIQNSIKHNPGGCNISVMLEKREDLILLIVLDDGAGLSTKKLQELEEKPHYMESMDERLDLRHGLGLLIVREIMAAHKGSFEIENVLPNGCKATMIFKVG